MIDLLESPKAVEILRFLQDHGGKVSTADLHAAFPDARDWIRELTRARCIASTDMRPGRSGDATWIAPSAYVLLPMGETVLAAQRREHEQRAQDRAEQEEAISQACVEKRKDRRHEYLVAAFGAVLGSLLTLLVEHFDELVAFLEQLVRQALAP